LIADDLPLSPLGRRCREAARGCYLTAMDANISRAASTETPEERERLLSQALRAPRKRIEDARAPNSLLRAAEAIEALRGAGGL
jgi:hypothetical protein